MLRSRKLGLRSLFVVLASLVIAGGSSLLFVQPAAAHGTATSPPSRQYSCWERWGDDFQNPAMAEEDPMCWQAWQEDTSTMWNWMGLYQEGMQGQHEQRIADGSLCSGGHARGGRYDSLDEVGPWHATPVGNDFTLHYNDQATHGADYYWVYVTEQGYDPTTEPLGWDDLERVVTTGVYQPGEPVDIPVSAPGRTGHHIVYVIWQASHLDQAFYSCSDVWFGGGEQPDPPEDPEDPTDPPEDPTDPPEDPTDPPAGDFSCSATATVNSWGSGATVQVTVSNTGSSDLHNWMLHWSWPSSDITVTNSWNAEISTMGGQQMAAPGDWNATIASGGSASFGFNVSGPLSSAPEFDCLAS